MGDGEICFTGLEVPANVTLEINLIKNKPIIWPMVETDTHTMIITSADTVDEAIYEATDRAVSFIEDSLNLTWEEAYITSLTVGYKISTCRSKNNSKSSNLIYSVFKKVEVINFGARSRAPLLFFSLNSP